MCAEHGSNMPMARVGYDCGRHIIRCIFSETGFASDEKYRSTNSVRQNADAADTAVNVKIYGCPKHPEVCWIRVLTGLFVLAYWPH